MSPAPAGAVRRIGAGPAGRAQQADLPGHRLDAHRGGVPDQRRPGQNVPTRARADHAGPQGAGVDAGQSGGARATAPTVRPICDHGGTLGGGRRPHHAARARRRRRRQGGRRSRAELSVRPAGRADVRAVGRRGRARLAGEGTDHSAAHRHRAATPRHRRVSRRRLPGRATDPRRPATLCVDGRHVRQPARRAAGAAG